MVEINNKLPDLETKTKRKKNIKNSLQTEMQTTEDEI